MERKLLRKEGFNAKRIWRAALFASTGLSAVVSLPAVLRAQTTIPSDTTPQGGVVVGGSASIAQAPASTTINQSSERAAINWQSFDVGSSAKVQFNQPDASAIALNRVVGGNLSQINGQINANGQIVLINQSGVVFGKGSQVNAENIVVSTSDIATKDFMAGNMAFTGAPNPGAKILNEGNITVKDTGLVGLIAPQVQNDGVIVARLGQVVLAGASAFTLDLYGDRLISLDVTKAVQAVDVNGQRVPALVTNRGVILADGGKVTLTAQDADALVTQLINAGGTIRADTVGSQTGTISIQGVGGDISIAGNLLARGGTASSGGAIEALTTGTVSVAPTADIDASGATGGGVIAIGTDIARAQQGASDVTAPKAAAVTIAQGATLDADATGLGNAGTVTLLSSQDTDFEGAISIQGGALGGNGGIAEISSGGVISLGGTVLATAINGKSGEILLDPQTLVVSGGLSNATITVPGVLTTVVGGFDTTTNSSTINNAQLDLLVGTIILEAASLISVAAPVNNLLASGVSLVSQGAISVTASIDISGSLDLDAAGSLFVGAGVTGSSVLLTSGTAGTEIDAGISGTRVTLGSTGTIFEDTPGSIVATNLLSAGSIGGNASLSGSNTIAALEGFTLGGNLTLANAGGLTVGGSVSAANISLSGASLTFESGVHTGILALSSAGTISQGAGTISATTLTGSAVSLASFTEPNAIGTLGAFSLSSGLLALSDAGSLDIGGNVSIGGTGTLALGGSAITQSGGSITAPTLSSLGTIGGNVSLASASNAIGTLGNFTLGGNLDLNDSTELHILGTVATPESITLAATEGGFDEPGGIDAATLSSGGVIVGNVIGAHLTGTNEIGTLGNFTVTNGGFELNDGESLIIAGTVDVPASPFAYMGDGVTETSTGAIIATGFNTSGVTVSGDVLLTGSNTISAINVPVAATGTFALNDASGLSVFSKISAADVTIASPTLALATSNLTIAATASTPSLVLATNDITTTNDATDRFRAGNGTIQITPFSGDTTIDIGAIASMNTLGLPGSIISALDPTAATYIFGSGPVGTQASGIDIDSSVSFASTATVDLSTSGTIFDNSGSLTAGTVEFGAPGGFTQSSAAGITATRFGGDGVTAGSALLIGANTINSFTSLPLSASSTLALFDAGTLTIAGAIDPAAVTLFGSLGLDIGTNVSSTLLELGSGGTIIQSGGSITADTLASFGSIGGDATLTSPTNSIGTLGGFTLGGTLDLADSGSLAVAGTVDGPFITLSAAGIGFTGAVTASNVLALASTDAITQTGGSITATTLSSIGTVNGNALFASTTNSIGTLGSFLAANTLTVFDSIALATAGTIAAPVVSLSAAGISFKGADVNAPTELALGGTGNIEQVVVGSPIVSISTGSLISIGTIGGDVLLGFGSGTSTIDVIGDFSLTGNFELANQTRANLTGVISTPDGTFGLVGGGLTETGAGAIDASQFNNVDDNAGGAYLGISGNLLLTGSNTISSLDTNTGASNAISTTGTFALNDTVPLTVGKEVLGADVTIAAPTLLLKSGATIAANTSTPTLALASDDITLAGANTFLASSGTIAIAAFSGGTTIGIGDASSTGTLGLPGSLVSALDTTASEIIIGNGPVGHQASAIDIDNSTSFGGTTVVDLSTSGLISQRGVGSDFNAAKLEFDSAGFTQNASDTIVAATLQGDGGTIGGSVLLPGSPNVIGVLTAISLATGTLSLNDNHSLTVAGTVAAPSVSLSTTIGPIKITGFVDAPTELALGSPGAITEPGSITTGLLTGEVGSATLTGTNIIATLGGFTLGGTLDLADSGSLAVAGPVDGSYITLSAAGIGFTGNATAGNDLALDSTGGISQTGGSLTAGTLTSIGAIGGNALLTTLTNSIGTLGNFSATGTLALGDSILLQAPGTISAPAVSLTADGITITGTLDAPTELALGGGGTIEQQGGTIDAGALVSIGTIGGHVYLGYFGTKATISAIGNFSLTSDFALDNQTSADITGVISTPASAEFDGGGVTETGAGAIDSSALDTNVQGDVLLTGSNTISSIDSFGAVASGTFALNNTVSLAVDGNVGAADVSIATPTLGLDANIDSTLAGGTLALALDGFTIASGTIGANAGTVELAPFTSGDGIDLGGSAANALDLTGNVSTLFGGNPVEYVIGAALGSHAGFIDVDSSVSFATGTVDLTTPGTIADNAGTLSAATLEFDTAGFTQASTAAIAATTLQGDGGTINGSVLLAGTANAIGTLGGLSLVSGTLALTDGGALNVVGSVTAPDIYLTDSNQNGISLGGGSLVANSGGTIGLTADALAGSTGTIAAPGGLVRIASLGTVAIDLGGTTPGDLELASGFIDLIGSKVLQIGTPGGGVITEANAVSVVSPTLVLDGSSLDFTGSLGVPTLLTFASAGDVSETTGATISVPTLTGTASGTIGLIGTNAIGTLDALSAGGNITLGNGPSLLIAGLVTTSLGNSITLDDNAGVTEVSGGTLAAGTLAGNIGGAAVLTSANAIGTIGGFTVANDLTFLNAGSLTLAGPVSAADAYITASGIGITGGVAAGGTLGLFSGSDITEAAPGGILTAGTLTGTVSSGSATLGSGNSISNLGAFTVDAGSFTLNNAIGLNISGPVSATDIALSGTSLTETTGSLTATALSTGSGGFTGNVSLTGANAIGTLGGFTLSAGTLTLDDTGLLTVSGPVNAPNTTLSAQTMAIAGTISASTFLALESTGDVFETLAGFISTPSLTSVGTIGGNVSLANSNAITTLASFATNGDLTLDDGGTLTVAGPVSAANAFLSANGMAITGGISATLVSLGSTAGITEPGGVINADTLSGTSTESTALLGGNSITTLGGFAVTSGNFGISNTSVLEIAGLVTAPGTISLEGMGDTEITGGTLSAGTLDSGGTEILGDVSLGNANEIATLAGFTLGAGGTLTLQDATLTVAGPVIAPVATLSAGSISIPGAITASTNLALESTGNITEAAGGIIDTPSLTSGGTTITGNVALTGNSNTINTLGGFALGAGSTLALDDTGLLTIAGPVSTPFATISANTLAVSGAFSGTTATFASGAGGIGVTGSISLTTLLGLASTGNVTENGGQISASTLISAGVSINGDVILGNTLNAIGTLGNFTIGSGHTLDLADSGSLKVAGTVSAPFATLSSDTIGITGTLSGTTATLAAGAGGIGITGLINTGTLLALASNGNITETGTGGIDTGTLVSVGTINGDVLLTDTLDNAISTLGGFTIGSADTLVLDDAGLLTVEGPVSAVNATFFAGTLAIAGALSGASQTLTGGNIIIEAPVSETTQLALETPGNVSETSAGTITTPLLTSGGTTIGSSLGNYVSLTTGANSIGTLGGLTLAGTLDLVDLGSPSLIIGGPVIAPVATISANTIAGAGDFSGTTATFSAGSIDIGGLVSLSTLLALESSGSITESAGTIDTATLTSGGTTIGGSVSLTDTANSIGTLGGFTLTPGGTLSLDLADSGLLTVAGPVDGPNVTLAGGALSITGSLNAAQTLALETDAGGVNESTGLITAGTLTSDGTTIQGTVALTSANTIATLSSFAATGFIVLDNSPSLTIDGLVSTPGALTLAQTGDITEVAGGTLAVGTLTSGTVATGDVALGNANSIGTLGGFTVASGDTLALTDTGLLTITGPVIAPFATIASNSIEASGTLQGGVATLSAGSIDIGGTISLTSVLALESTGNITESTGFITVPTLTSGGTVIAGNVTLGDVNSIGTLGGFTTASDMVLNDGTLLTVGGPVSAADATLTADGIAIPGAITTTGTLALFSATAVTETGGAVTAALLTGTVSSGSATLQGTNTIATLGAFTVAAGTLALDDTGLLTVAGPVAAPTTTLSADTIAVTGAMSGAATTLTAGSIGISGAITATSALALESTGNITETSGGVISTPLLNSGGTTITGDVALNGTANVISTLGGFTLGTGSTLTLDDTGLLTVNGPVDAPFTTLSSGAIAITGSLNAPEALALESTGNISETGGFISTTSLTSGGTSIGGNVALTGTNVINTLGAFTDTGTLTLDDTGLLTVAGPVTAPVATISAPTIAIDGALDAATQLALASSGNITEVAGGAITTGELTSGGTIGGDVTLNSPANEITTLGQFSAAGLALDDQSPLAVAAPVTVSGVLALLDPGNVTQTGGAISAGTLTSDGGTIGGAAAFNQPGNDIPVLGAFGAVAGLALTDAVPLNLAGNIFTGSAAPLTLTDTGGAITQSAGAISAGVLNVSGSNVTLGQANAIGTAGAITASNAYVNGVNGISGPVSVGSSTFVSSGGLPVSGNISAATNLVLEALGGISQTAGSITSSAATLIAGGDLILSGVLAAAGDLDLVAGGNISHPAGELTAGTLSGGVGGTVITPDGAVNGSGSLASFNFSSFTTDFGTIGNFIMQDSTFALINDGPLTLLGSLVANTVTIATNGPLTLDGTSDGTGGGLFIDANQISATPYFTPQPGDSVITVTNGGITQTGMFDINPGTNTAAGDPANLFLYVLGGSVAFSTSGELYGPTTNLEVSDAQGAISGNIDLERLVILNALTQSVELTGTLDGLGGQAAASKGFVDPFPEPEFRINACPIGSVNCTILPIETLPPGNPLENFDLSQRKRRKLNNNVHLPGVATRDF